MKIFEGFSIQRWTDLVRPLELVEMDKSAEKMVAAYIIGKYEESRGKFVDWKWMIYASIFDLLKKIALCDIKSPVQRMIKKQFPEEYLRLNEWVLSQYKNVISDSGFYSDFALYIHQTNGSVPIPEKTFPAYRILRAAHKFSTLREFEMIACVNEEERLLKIKRNLNEDIQQFLDLQGMQMLVTRQRPFDFIMMIEQLRFQTRWNQTPRIPQTTVLGHCFFVAVMTVLLMRETGIKICEKRLFNDFFSALFHDLPEAVTRDIISPVKQATDELPLIVKKIEEEIVATELVPLMDDFYVDEILYFAGDEFANRIELPADESTKFSDSDSVGKIKKKSIQVTWEDLNEKYNHNSFNPVDGKTVRLADHLAALIESDFSIKYGITSEHLRSGRENLLTLYPQKTVINGIDINSLFNSLINSDKSDCE